MNGQRTCYMSLLLVLSVMVSLPAQAREFPGPPQLIVRADGAGTALSLDNNVPFHRTANEVIHSRLIDVPGSSIRLALWQEAGDGQIVPFYAISLDGKEMATVRSTSYVLKVRHGDFEPIVFVPPVDTSLAADEATNLYIVQFVTQPLEEFRAAIEDLGGTVYHFLANHGHIVKMDPDVRDRVATLPYVRWVGSFHPAYRLEEFVRDNGERAAELFPEQRYNIQVFEAGDAQKGVVADRIRALGGTVNTPDAGKYLLEATLTPAQLFEVARWDEVLFIDRWSPYEEDMDIVREIAGADYIETVAGYTGQGVRAEVFDAGFNLNHPDFASRPLIEHGGPVGLDSHGTATAGICFGDGTGDSTARGLLPDAQGIVADYNNIGLYGANRYTHTGELVQAPYYAVFQTASVGSDRTTEYTTISADTDATLFDFDIVHCQSQSNAGDRMSRPQAWAKNIVSGGAVNHYNTLTRDDDCWCGGASIGPASDGRIKPDLNFFYDLTWTTYTTGDGYGNFGGTSGATPSICGHFGLFFQMWSDGIFGNEVDPGGTVFDNRPHMTTAKAFMINTADPYPFTGTSHDLTRVNQGWGRPDVQYLYDMRDNISFIDESELLANTESAEYAAYVESGEPALRMTLTYADPPGVPASSQHRINDLTLKVTSPSSTVYWGNNGLLEGIWSVAGGSADTFDTVENVFIENPEAGVWTVEVIASEINEDGHVETPELDADFALVVSGAFLATCTSDGRIMLDDAKYACADEAGIRVVDCDLNTNDTLIETVTITIDSTSEPAGETVLLTETGPETADFRGTMPLSTTNSSGVLQVADGDTITATYIDADDGQGGQNVTVTDTATVDCTGPVISNVQITDIGSEDATVTFDTDERATGTVRYGLSCGTLTETVSESSAGTSHALVLTGLADGTQYSFAVDVVDEQGNASTDDNGGSCYSFSTLDVVYSFPLDTDPGWTTEGLWAWGQPTGGGGQYGGPDPIGGYTGSNVYGYNLNGDYENYLSETHLTSTAIDCTGLSNVGLKFWRWLGVEQPLYDHAYVRVSNNGTNWTTIWENAVEVTDYVWTAQEFDISPVADNQPTVYLRWTMGPTDTAWQYCGWNIDDIQIIALGGSEPTCNDGIQNQGEDRIDCGGPCPPCDCLSDGECDDGLYCTGVETCDAYGHCRSGTPVDCDDGVGCTDDSCNEDTDSCDNVPHDAHCDNGLYCDGAETCDPVLDCQPGTDPCPGQDCDEENDQCVPMICNNNGTCELGEDCNNCPNDCFTGVGASCGNTICEAANGEDCISCPGDCNSKLGGKPDGRYCCGDGSAEYGVTCSDSRCTGGGNTCTADPVIPSCCGDGTCEGTEDSFNCEVDCGPPPVCGDDICNGGENQCNCPDDCGTPPASETDCADGIDNDCDDLIDGADPDCTCLARGEACTLDSECCSNWCHRGACK